MKRVAVDAVGSSGGPQSKKAHSEEQEDGEDTTPAQFTLIHQNKGLSLELMSSKRAVAEARKELDLMRRKSREMETLVSLIQRAWSQLDIDASLVLDSLGDVDTQNEDVCLADGSSSQLLQRLLHVHQRYAFRDPTSLESQPRVACDQYMSSAEINAEKAQALEDAKTMPAVSDAPSAMDDTVPSVDGTTVDSRTDNTRMTANNRKSNNTIESSDYIDEISGEIESHLAQHVQFTLSLLERLCFVVNEGGALQSNPEVLRALIVARESQAKILFLNDTIASLRADIVEQETLRKAAEFEKLKVEKRLDKSMATIQSLQSRTASSSGDGSGQHNESQSAVLSSAQAAATAEQLEELRELKHTVSMLEKQLAESEKAKAKAEMTLTERLSRPLTQTETQIADMRRAMEDLRGQCKQRVAALVTENESLLDKVKQAELAIREAEQHAMTRVEQVIAATVAERQQLQQEREKAESKLCTAQAGASVADQLRAQMSERERLEQSQRSEIQLLQREVKLLRQREAQAQQHVNASREREKLLQDRFALYLGEKTAESLLQSMQELEEGEQPEPGEDFQLLLKTSQDRCAELQGELGHLHEHVNDLILEIDAAGVKETDARKNCERLLAQVADSQGFQRDALEENCKLQNQLQELRNSNKDMQSKTEIAKSLLAQQDSLLVEARSNGVALKAELQSVQHELRSAQQQCRDSELAHVSVAQRLSESESAVEAATKRNAELQARCDELSKQCEKERKQRMEEQRELSKTKRALKNFKAANESAGNANSSGNGSSSSMSDQDADMLELTLSMLRCSVCKDRFKSVAITRCFHLFCKECIDETLRNRSRKCPACGEKFGQDDVANIYFTN